MSNITTIQIIALGLVGTLKKREINHKEERDRLIWKCDKAEEHLDHIHNIPDSYVENTGNTPAFIIPTRNGEYELAYYIKRLSEGQVAGYLKASQRGTSSSSLTSSLSPLRG